MISSNPNQKNNGAWPSFLRRTCKSIQMLVETFWYHQEHTHQEYGSPTHGTFDLESQSWKSQYVNCI
jgi:hypothetical protein